MSRASPPTVCTGLAGSCVHGPWRSLPGPWLGAAPGPCRQLARGPSRLAAPKILLMERLKVVRNIAIVAADRCRRLLPARRRAGFAHVPGGRLHRLCRRDRLPRPAPVSRTPRRAALARRCLSWRVLRRNRVRRARLRGARAHVGIGTRRAALVRARRRHRLRVPSRLPALARVLTADVEAGSR